MIKKGIVIVFLLFSFFSSTLAQIPAGCESIPCELIVERIDSTTDYMIIYTFNDKRKFKIVTRNVENDCRNVFVGDSIHVTLCSMNSMDPFYHHPYFQPCDWSYGWSGYNNHIPNEVEYGCDIFLTDDIFGLCLTDDLQCKEDYLKYIQEHPLSTNSIRGARAYSNEQNKKGRHKPADRGKRIPKK